MGSKVETKQGYTLVNDFTTTIYEVFKSIRKVTNNYKSRSNFKYSGDNFIL